MECVFQRNGYVIESLIVTMKEMKTIVNKFFQGVIQISMNARIESVFHRLGYVMDGSTVKMKGTKTTANNQVKFVSCMI